MRLLSWAAVDAVMEAKIRGRSSIFADKVALVCNQLADGEVLAAVHGCAESAAGR